MSTLKSVRLQKVFLVLFKTTIYNEITIEGRFITVIKYKIDVVKELSNRGYTTSLIRKNKWISEATMTKIRRGENINTSTLNTLCVMLKCQPGDILEVEPTDEEKVEYY